MDKQYKVNIQLAIIRLDYNNQSKLADILSDSQNTLVLPTINILDNTTIKNKYEQLCMKYTDLSVNWIKFMLIETEILDDTINIIYGCCIPYDISIKQGYWLETPIGTTKQCDLVTKVLNNLANIPL